MGRVRGVGREPISRTNPLPRSGERPERGGGGSPPEVRNLGCKRCKGRVALSLKGDRDVDEAERRDVELRTSTS